MTDTGTGGTCQRSHPHEHMDEVCHLRAEIARLNAELASARSAYVEDEQGVCRACRKRLSGFDGLCSACRAAAKSVAVEWCLSALETIQERGCENHSEGDCYDGSRGPDWVPCSPCIASQAINTFVSPTDNDPA